MRTTDSISLVLGLVFATLTAGLASCSGDDASGPGSSSGGTGGASAGAAGGTGACPETFAALQAAILEPSCAASGCHGEASPAAGLRLKGANVEGQLVGVESSLCDGWIRVVPGDTSRSLLFQKLSAPSPCGGVMPPGQELPDAEKSCIEQWINGLPTGAAGQGGAGGSGGATAGSGGATAGFGGATAGSGGAAGGSGNAGAGGCETCGG